VIPVRLTASLESGGRLLRKCGRPEITTVWASTNCYRVGCTCLQSAQDTLSMSIFPDAYLFLPYVIWKSAQIQGSLWMFATGLFLQWKVVTPRPTSKLEAHSLSAVRGCILRMYYAMGIIWTLYNHRTDHGYLTNLWMMFLDFEKACDCLNRNKVWEAMNSYGVPWHITNAVKKLCQVVHEDTIAITGVRRMHFVSHSLSYASGHGMNKAILGKKGGINGGVSQWLRI
jgi:hypothetical protein